MQALDATRCVTLINEYVQRVMQHEQLLWKPHILHWLCQLWIAVICKKVSVMWSVIYSLIENKYSKIQLHVLQIPIKFYLDLFSSNFQCVGTIVDILYL